MEIQNFNQIYERIKTPTLKKAFKVCKTPKYKNHKWLFWKPISLSFSAIVCRWNVCSEINKLNYRKFIQDTDISVKILKENEMLFSNYIWLIFSEAISSSKFRSSLKYANITPAFTKCYRNFKENYRPVNILPIIFKIFEKLMSKQLSTYFQSVLSKFQFLEWIQCRALFTYG